MAKLSWLIRRLKAMSISEVLWRLSQKSIEKKEKALYQTQKTPVTARVFDPALAGLRADPKRLGLNLENRHFACNTAIPLLADAAYETYKTRWNAGFQTDAVWPDTFSYDLQYKQNDAVGDARTNWELNRHFQFALLAKDYAATGEKRYLTELSTLFADWNEKNAFLHGISWTSVMETAVRCINWVYAYGFLASAKAPEKLLEEMRVGILNMTDYVRKHYSRFSSANNHLIVEACAIGHSGILFGHQPWVELAVQILTRELPLQNYPDGVNRELSLHYQSFYMEAMGLMLRLMKKNAQIVPASWYDMLDKMCRYTADCLGDYGEAVVFGDDDEGKIMDLDGVPEGEMRHEPAGHYRYVLGMLSMLLGRQYVALDGLKRETLHWLFTDSEWADALRTEVYQSPRYCCYKEGGNTILRSDDRKVLIGIDHAALGFGSICAHAQADALSFQVYFEGKPLLNDPGTYIYHCDLPHRNAFRETRNHNTVCVGGKNQSEMLGAFLWGGKRAHAELESFSESEGGARLVMTQDGYAPVIHRRTLSFDGGRRITVLDELSEEADAEADFLFGPDLRVTAEGQRVTLGGDGWQAELYFEGAAPRLTEREFSRRYGVLEKGSGVMVPFRKTLKTEMILTETR